MLGLPASFSSPPDPPPARPQDVEPEQDFQGPPWPLQADVQHPLVPEQQGLLQAGVSGVWFMIQRKREDYVQVIYSDLYKLVTHLIWQMCDLMNYI